MQGSTSCIGDLPNKLISFFTPNVCSEPVSSDLLYKLIGEPLILEIQRVPVCSEVSPLTVNAALELFVVRGVEPLRECRLQFR